MTMTHNGRLSEAQKYVVDPCAPFPKHWKDAHGPIRVMSEPTEGYLMCRRPHGVPFVLHVKHILNAERHPHQGPFELTVSRTVSRKALSDRSKG